jgi:hypothetical protein
VGWAVGDSRAASGFGAPIAISSSHPRVLYVSDETVMRRFRRPAIRHPPRGCAYPAQRMQNSGGAGTWATLPPRIPAGISIDSKRLAVNRNPN